MILKADSPTHRTKKERKKKRPRSLKKPGFATSGNNKQPSECAKTRGGQTNAKSQPRQPGRHGTGKITSAGAAGHRINLVTSSQDKRGNKKSKQRLLERMRNKTTTTTKKKTPALKKSAITTKGDCDRAASAGAVRKRKNRDYRGVEAPKNPLQPRRKKKKERRKNAEPKLRLKFGSHTTGYKHCAENVRIGE